ncbi:MAG TPA: hypothetical protein VJB02_07060 [Coxiellaceae bacterium]|nr:hypothetical protein [Coxiellaceae bacterium]
MPTNSNPALAAPHNPDDAQAEHLEPVATPSPLTRKKKRPLTPYDAWLYFLVFTFALVNAALYLKLLLYAPGFFDKTDYTVNPHRSPFQLVYFSAIMGLVGLPILMSNLLGMKREFDKTLSTDPVKKGKRVSLNPSEEAVALFTAFLKTIGPAGGLLYILEKIPHKQWGFAGLILLTALASLGNFYAQYAIFKRSTQLRKSTPQPTVITPEGVGIKLLAAGYAVNNGMPYFLSYCALPQEFGLLSHHLTFSGQPVEMVGMAIVALFTLILIYRNYSGYKHRISQLDPSQLKSNFSDIMGLTGIFFKTFISMLALMMFCHQLAGADMLTSAAIGGSVSLFSSVGMFAGEMTVFAKLKGKTSSPTVVVGNPLTVGGPSKGMAPT